MPVFDTHCHLGLDDRGDAVAEHARALAADVTDFVVVGIDAASSARARDLARGLAGARWSAGLHPNDAFRRGTDWTAIERLCDEPDCAAIGETGLDHYRTTAAHADQETALRAHLELARRRRLPVILHCRDAFAPLHDVLADFAPLRGVMHCFSGDAAGAARAVGFGLHVSFAAPLTYPKNAALREAAAAVPADRLLVETDAPFLPPQGRRGQRNEPAFVLETVRALAAVRGWDAAATATTTHRNAIELFGARR
jgi:TatD DNase family protein